MTSKNSVTRLSAVVSLTIDTEENEVDMMNPLIFFIKKYEVGNFYILLFIALCGLLLIPFQASAVEHAAQIINLQGKGELKPFNAKDWDRASVKQQLEPGSYVRTGDMSNMALLFRDQTQVRLNQNSQLQIKTVAEVSGANVQTAVKLNAGRAWAQTKNVSGTLKMETPTATMSIRGTDWDIEVADDGKSTLTVLSGSIDFFNDYGNVTVNKGEQAVAEQGKAPVKLLISNPKERVQWVTSYEVDALRHIRLSNVENVTQLQDRATNQTNPLERATALFDLRRRAEAQVIFEQILSNDSGNQQAIAGMTLLSLYENNLDSAGNNIKLLDNSEISNLVRVAFLTRSGDLRAAKNLLESLVAKHPLQQPAGYLILSDMMVYQGQLNQAIEANKLTLELFPNSALILAHQSKLQLLADSGAESAMNAQLAIAKNPDLVEPYLSSGEYARWNGETQSAQANYNKATKLNPQDDRGWFGLGVVLNEREDARRGREALSKAIELNPDGPGYQGELGTLETFANQLNAASVNFDLALERNSSDYIALTGKGLMFLKQGKFEDALKEFLQATVLEPRFARAHLYTGIAYYQLGRTTRAIEEIEKASELDPLDPMPSMLTSMIRTDYFEPAKAVAASRKANDLMPYLKSMNQLANNQKGVANVGNSLSFWGMKNWASHYAQVSYFPFWAGSHLFLSDIYDGKFAKSSELFQGYLTDPTVFGASNRFQTLIHLPGHYQSYSTTVARDREVMNFIPKVTLNGQDNSWMPIAYFLDVDNKISNDRSAADFNYHDNTKSFTGAIGLMPTNEFRLFAYGNREYVRADFENSKLNNLDFDLVTSDFSVGGSYALNPISILRAKYGENHIRANEQFGNVNGNNDFFNREISNDYQLAWQGKLNNQIELNVGAERATSPESFSWTISDKGTLAILRDDRNKTSEQTNLGYISGKINLSERSFLQIDAVYTDYQKTIKGELLNFNGTITPVHNQFSVRKLSPRIGVAWDFGGDHTLRAAYQDWVRPSSSNTLGPVATAGIPLDETLTAFGGRIHRLATILESEWSPTLYTEISIDHKRAKNLDTVDISLAEGFASLAKIKQRNLLDVVNSQAGESNAEYENLRFSTKSDITQLKFTANKILTSTISTIASYINTDSDIKIQTLDMYLPRHQVILGATWVSPLRVRLNADVNWRSKGNTFLGVRDDYASANLSAYWETDNKRIGLATFIRDAFSPYESAYYGVAATVRY